MSFHRPSMIHTSFGMSVGVSSSPTVMAGKTFRHRRDTITSDRQLVALNSQKKLCLPCMHMICVGSCPYRERCCFIHDPRLFAKNIKFDVRRKKKTAGEYGSYDLFNWSPIECSVDNSGHLDAAQKYSPPVQEYTSKLWNSFVTNISNNLSELEVEGSRRLSVFTNITQGIVNQNPLPIQASIAVNENL